MLYGHLWAPPYLSWKSVDIGEESEPLQFPCDSESAPPCAPPAASSLRHPRLWALVVAVLLQLSSCWCSFLCVCRGARSLGALALVPVTRFLTPGWSLWPCPTHLAPLLPAGCPVQHLSLEPLPTGNQLPLRLSLQYVFDYQQGDVFGCVADIGWITGHSYVVYGPLCNGATSVLFESTPVYPDPGEEVVGKGLARGGKRSSETCPAWPACSGEVSCIALDNVYSTLRNICEPREGKKKVSLLLLCTHSSNSSSFGC